MATSKTGGSTSNGRDSIGKRLGIKLFSGEAVFGGEIIVRQRGTQYHPGKMVGMGKDHTLYAKGSGVIRFHYGSRGKKYISIDATSV